MSFLDLSSELVGRLPGLSVFLAETFINRAWREIRDERQWSFLAEICAIVCPTQATAGTVAITKFSTTVTCNAAASAALAVVAASLPSPLDLTAVQIRFGGQNNTSAIGQVYSIASADVTNPVAYVLTLDRFVAQETNATSGYQCYRAYIRPTIDDFLTWDSFVDMTNGWALRRNFSSTYFDARDPQRQAQGQAYFVGGFLGNPGSQPRPQYELWPHPTSGQVFLGRFRRQGVDFADPNDQQAPIIPDSLIMERALGFHGYRWANENIGRIPQLKGPNYAQLMVESRGVYRTLLTEAKKNDDSQELQGIYNRGHGLVNRGGTWKGMGMFPIDSNFMQSHLLNL